MSTPDHPAGGIDRVRERLNVVTQETRFSLVQDILGHPAQLPTLKELDYVNPSKSQTDRKSTRLNSSHIQKSRMPSSA